MAKRVQFVRDWTWRGLGERGPVMIDYMEGETVLLPETQWPAAIESGAAVDVLDSEQGTATQEAGGASGGSSGRGKKGGA